MPHPSDTKTDQVGSKIAFLHIYKTGGMSLRGLFAKNYRQVPHFNTGIEGLNAESWAECLTRIEQMSPEELDRYRVFKGHMQLGLHEIVPGGLKYITFLREPVARIISHYQMLFRLGTISEGHQIDLSRPDWNVPCASFLSSLDNGQTRVLGQADLDLPLGGCTEAHYERAIANIEKHFTFVGLTEKFDLSLILLGRICGWSWHFYVPDNRAPVKSIPIQPEVVKAITDMNVWDRRLYRYVQERFARQVAFYGLSLQAEHALFRLGNKGHQKLHVWRHAVKKRLGIEKRPVMAPRTASQD